MCTLKNQMAASHRRPEQVHRAPELEGMLSAINFIIYYIKTNCTVRLFVLLKYFFFSRL